MKQFLILALLFFALSRNGAGQVRGQSDTTRPDSAKKLKEVIVRGTRPPVQQSIAGTVVNVQSSIMSKGSSVLDVLERSPGVQLDHQHNDISLNGKSGVTVMIDGKVLHMPTDEVAEMLRGMSADNIEKIELLNAPPSRYDASGSAGIINIVLKKNQRPGTTGSFSVNGGYGWGEKAGASANLEHNDGKTDWYGSYSFLHDHNYAGFRAAGSAINPAIGPSAFVFHDTDSYVNNNHSALLGVERRLRPGFVLGASVSYNNNTTTSVTRNAGAYTIPPDSVLVFRGKILGRSQWNNVIASFTAEKEWRKGEKLGIGVDWLDYTNHRPSNVLGNFVDSHGETVGITGDSLFASANKGYSDTKIRVGVGKADYTVPLGEKGRFEAGFKADHTQSGSESGIESLINGHWVTSAASANAIRMREDIGAGYVSWHLVPWTSTTVDAGVRYEYSDTRLNDAVTGVKVVDRRLGLFFPSLLLTQKAGENSQWQLSFSRRISRPSYKDLSSFISYNDPFSVFTGNPLLKPTITNNLKLGYSNHGYSLSVLFSRDENPIFGWAATTQPGSQLVYIRPVNLDFQNNLTFEANLPFSVGNWWTMNYGFVGGWRQYRVGYIPNPVEKTWFGYSVTYRETFTLPARWSAEVSGWYDGTSYEALSRNNGFGELNLGVKKELNRNRGSLQLAVTDVFRTMNIKTNVGAVANDAYNTHAAISYDTETRKFPIFRLTWSRSFGSGATAQPKEGRAGEEKARIK